MTRMKLRLQVGLLAVLFMLAMIFAADHAVGWQTQPASQGQQLFEANCASCHGSTTGAVTGNLIGKPLLNNEFVQSHTDAELLTFIKEGRSVEHPDNTTGV